MGGGGYWLLHRQKDDLETVIDGRERAPLAADSKMYLDKNGKVIYKKTGFLLEGEKKQQKEIETLIDARLTK